MRATRLLTMLNSLQGRGRVTAAELAAECGVSLRTVYRDVDALSAAGIPVYAERGSEGGYRLVDGYRTQLTGLSPKEAEAVFMTGLAGPAADLGLGALVAGAQVKLLAALPARYRAGAEQMRARFHLDAPTWYGQAEQPSYLPAIADAVWTQRRLRIRYRSWQAEKRRLVDPLGVVLKGGAWYFVGRVDGTPRTYRVGRVLELDVLDERFERPQDFNLAAYWTAATARLEADMHANVAQVRLSVAGVRMLSAVLSPYAQAKVEVEDAVDEHGWRRARIPVGGTWAACLDLLRFGADAEVLAPVEVRDMMARMSADMAALYARPAARRGKPKRSKV
jgi:predicted DNA-binding transcriptional regulator YafY